jgi:hypothetical protein
MLVVHGDVDVDWNENPRGRGVVPQLAVDGVESRLPGGGSGMEKGPGGPREQHTCD